MNITIYINRSNEDLFRAEAEKSKLLNELLAKHYGLVDYKESKILDKVSVNGGDPMEVLPGGEIRYTGKTPPTIIRVPEPVVEDAEDEEEQDPFDGWEIVDYDLKQAKNESTGEWAYCKIKGGKIVELGEPQVIEQ